MLPSTKRLIIAIIGLLLFMEMLDSTVLNTALPQIAKAIHNNPIELKVALTFYLLSLGIFIHISGWLADPFGAKRILQIAVVIFVVGSIGCGLSVNLANLVLFRIIQGIGGAFMMPVGRLVLLRTMGKEGIVLATPKVATIGLIGSSIGPVIGGALTTYLSWRWIFFLNIPVGILMQWSISRFFPDIPPEKTEPFDFFGFVLFGAGLALLLFSLDVIVD